MKPIQKNESLSTLIRELKRLSLEQGAPIWKSVATDLERPTRNRRVVNVYKIDANTKENDVVIVPGKVLGVGELTHPVTVAALSFSEEAQGKIEANGSAISIAELVKKNPKGAKVRILG